MCPAGVLAQFVPVLPPSMPYFNSSPWLNGSPCLPSGIWYVMSNFYSGEQLSCTAENTLQRHTSTSNMTGDTRMQTKSSPCRTAMCQPAQPSHRYAATPQEASSACAHVRWQHPAPPVPLEPDCALRAPSLPSDLHSPCWQVVGAPIAAALLALDGLFGVAGWQYLFLLEGDMSAASVEACCCSPAGRPVAWAALDTPQLGLLFLMQRKDETHVVRTSNVPIMCSPIAKKHVQFGVEPDSLAMPDSHAWQCGAA